MWGITGLGKVKTVNVIKVMIYLTLLFLQKLNNLASFIHKEIIIKKPGIKLDTQFHKNKNAKIFLKVFQL